MMRAEPQIASSFEQLELPVWTESQELRRFITGYLALLPIKRSSAAIDNRFVEYLLELFEGVTGRITKRQSAITSRGSSRLPTKDRESRKEPQ